MQAHTESWVAATKRCLVNLAAGVAMAACHTCAMGADFVLLQQSQVPPPPWDTHHYLDIKDASSSSKGGVLIAGGQGDSRSWTFYVSGAMHLDWSKIIEQGWPRYGAVAITDSRDGGFWVVGYGQTIDTRQEERKNGANRRWITIRGAAAFDYVSHLDETGRLLWQRALFTGASHRIYCVKEGSDGLFVSGYDSLPAIVDGDAAGETSVTVPWVAKLDKQGSVLWERRVAKEDEPILISDAHSVPTCTALEAGDDGGVTTAAVVEQIERAKRGPDGLHVPAQYERHLSSKGTLIAKFDGAGNKLQTIKLDSTAVDKTFLFATSRGFTVVDHIRPTGDLKQVKSVLDILPAVRELISRSGVRITDLNSDLARVDEENIIIPPFFDRVSAVLPLRAGGFFIGGCDVDSKNSIAWITPSGSVGAVRKLDPAVGLSRCANMALGRTDSDDDFMLFTDAPSGYNVLRIRSPAQ